MNNPPDDDFQPPKPGEPDPHAPKIPEGFLENLKGMVMRKMRNGHRTKHVPVSDKPNRFCRICTRLWVSRIILAGDELQPAICEECQKELDNGAVAVIVPNTRKHCFIYSPTVASGLQVGQEPILEVSEETFGFMQAEAIIQKTKKN